jgi:hypothetical protein
MYSALRCMDSKSAHEVVMMDRPVSRSASMEMPTQPSISRTVGMTASRT